jgi:DNA repair protein RecO (recombination protein O)
MLSSTKAIVLKSTKYAENSLIVKTYTEEFGLITYMVSGIHGKKSKAALFLPMSILEVVAIHKHQNKLIRPKEIRISKVLSDVHLRPYKASVLIFINELVYKCIQEFEPNLELFDFLYHSIVELEESKESTSNFHLRFLLQFTRYLGFYPQGSFDTHYCFFNLQEGVFTSQKSNVALDEMHSKWLFDCMQDNYAGIKNREIRNEILLKFILFYQFHVHGFSKIQSLDILQEIAS